MKKKYTKTERLVGTAILIALVVVLQTIASGIKLPFLPVPLNLTLIPIIIGAVMFDAGTGALLGCVFSFIVLMSVISGADAIHHVFFEINPIPIVIICLLKGTAAGYLAGLAAKVVSKGKNLSMGVLLASIIAPIVNTGIYVIGVLLFFRDQIATYSNGTNVVYFTLFSWIGINFVVEFVVDVVLSPIIVRILETVRKSS